MKRTQSRAKSEARDSDWRRGPRRSKRRTKGHAHRYEMRKMRVREDSEKEKDMSAERMLRGGAVVKGERIKETQRLVVARRAAASR